MFEIFKAELPNNAPVAIQSILIKKGKKYSLGYIRNVIYVKNGPENIDIYEAALELCNREIDRKIALNESILELKEKLTN